MTEAKKKSKAAGKLVGGLIFIGAVASVFLVDWKAEVEEEPMIVRPIKSMLIESSIAAGGQTFPGKVSAGRSVSLAFEVSGNVIEKLVNKGDEVVQGQLLMKIDPSDFKNDYDAAVAESDRANAQFERMKKAAESNAVSKQEVDNARATYDQAIAAVNIKKKALDDTGLKASFAGTIANTYVKQFQTVQAKQQILSLQDISTIEIDVSAPESVVANAKPDWKMEDVVAVASFDFFPDRSFAVKMTEFTTEADAATQTYTATFAMPRPDDVNLLPGMTATVTVHPPEGVEFSEEKAFPVPLDAVPVDGLGQYFVWKLAATEGGVFAAERSDVDVGEAVGNQILVTGGLAKGDRIALAGVHVLVEGQEVRLLDAEVTE